MRADLIRAERDLEATYWWFVGRRAILQDILRRFGIHSSVAVDVGCGSGRNMQLLACHADLVLGVDRSPAALEASCSLPKVRADATALPLADSSVDLVSALDVLEHLDDDLQGLNEFQRVLLPAGFLLITVPAYRFLWSEHDEALAHRRRYSASELHVKLTRAGFRVLKRSYVVFFAFFPISVYRLFRGLFPKNHFAPMASHIELPAFLNRSLIASLKLEAYLTRAINIPMGTSIVVLAQKGQQQPARAT